MFDWSNFNQTNDGEEEESDDEKLTLTREDLNALLEITKERKDVDPGTTKETAFMMMLASAVLSLIYFTS